MNTMELTKKEKGLLTICMVIVIAITVAAGILTEAKELDTPVVQFSSNEEIYMYCFNHWDELGVLPSVAIAMKVKTEDDITQISSQLSSAKNNNMFTEQLNAIEEYDSCYLSIRQLQLYNYDYQMFIAIAEEKKVEAQNNIEDAEQLANICRQYDAEIQAYTACLNN